MNLLEGCKVRGFLNPIIIDQAHTGRHWIRYWDQSQSDFLSIRTESGSRSERNNTEVAHTSRCSQRVPRGVWAGEGRADSREDPLTTALFCNVQFFPQWRFFRRPKQAAAFLQKLHPGGETEPEWSGWANWASQDTLEWLPFRVLFSPLFQFHWNGESILNSTTAGSKYMVV